MTLLEYMTETERNLFQLALEAAEDAAATMRRILNRVDERLLEEDQVGRT